MKFGKQLEAAIIPKWRGAYIDYKRLKKVLKQTAPLARDDLTITTRFLSALQQELDHVNALVAEEEAHAMGEAAELAAARRSVPVSRMEDRRQLQVRTRALYANMEALNSFVEINYTACYKIAKKHDKVTRRALMGSILRAVEAQPFLRTRLNDGAGTLSGLTATVSTGSGAQAVTVQFDATVAAVRNHAAEGLSLVSPELEPHSVHARLAELDAPLAELRARLVEGHVDGAVARAELFSAVARMLAREVALCNPEGVTGLEHLLQLHAMTTGGGPTAPVLRMSANGSGSSSDRTDAAAAALAGPSSSVSRDGSSSTGGGGGLLALVASASAGNQSSIECDSASVGGEESGWSTSSGGGVGTSGSSTGGLHAWDPHARRASMSSFTGSSAYSNDDGDDETGGEEGDGYGSSAAVVSHHRQRHPSTGTTPAAASALALQLWHRWRPAIFDWAPHYKLRKYLPRDLLAGVTIGVFLVPQGLAYATLVGLPPVHGLYCGLPAAAYVLFGTSRQGAIGPQSIPALLIASSLSGLSPRLEGAAYVDAVLTVTALVGAMLLVAGWLRLGFLVRFVSRPVLSGFAAGSAVLTIGSSLKDALGVPIARSAQIHDMVIAVVAALPNVHWPTPVLTSIAIILLLLLLPRAPWSGWVPPALQLTLLAVGTFALWMKVTGLDGERGGDTFGGGALGPGDIALVGNVPGGFSTPSWPRVPSEYLPSLLTTAASVALVGFLESAAVAQSFAVKHGYDVSPTSELKALGVVNLLGAALGAQPVMAAFGRSSINDNAGARSALAQVVSAGTVVAALLVAGPALYYLPQAVLAAIIIVAVSGLIDVKYCSALWRSDKTDFACVLLSFGFTIWLGVLYGVAAAVGISLVLFIGAATRSQVVELGRVRGTVSYASIGSPGVAPLRGVRALRVDAPLWFANAPVLRDRVLGELRARLTSPPRLRWNALIIDCTAVTSVDSTAAGLLGEAISAAVAARVPVLLAGLSAGSTSSLTRAGVVTMLGGPRFLSRSVHDAIRAIASRDLPPLPPPVLTSANGKPHARRSGGNGGAGGSSGVEGDALSPTAGSWFSFLMPRRHRRFHHRRRELEAAAAAAAAAAQEGGASSLSLSLSAGSALFHQGVSVAGEGESTPLLMGLTAGGARSLMSERPWD